MTPKAQAIILHTLMYGELGSGISWEEAKRCALIAVDTILKGSRLFWIEDYEFWKEVKQELKKL